MMRGSAPRLAVGRPCEPLAPVELYPPPVRSPIALFSFLMPLNETYAPVRLDRKYFAATVKPLVRLSESPRGPLTPSSLPVQAYCASSCHWPSMCSQLTRLTFCFAVSPGAAAPSAISCDIPGTDVPEAGVALRPLFSRRSWMTEICEPAAYAQPTPTLKPL